MKNLGAALVAGLLGVVLEILAFLSFQKLLEISKTPNVKIGGASEGAEGEVDMSGTVEGLSGGAKSFVTPLVNRECVFYSLRNQVHSSRTHTDSKGRTHTESYWADVGPEEKRLAPFVMHDDSGKITVNAESAEFEVESSTIGTGFNTRAIVNFLPLGKTVFVHGMVSKGLMKAKLVSIKSEGTILAGAGIAMIIEGLLGIAAIAYAVLFA